MSREHITHYLHGLNCPIPGLRQIHVHSKRVIVRLPALRCEGRLLGGDEGQTALWRAPSCSWSPRLLAPALA